MKVAVLGATGFTGEKLVELLLSHSQVELSYISSRTNEPVPYADLFPRFAKKTQILCSPMNVDTAADCADIVFLSLPHTVSMQFAPRLLERGKKVIDLSADYRLSDSGEYMKFYKADHTDKPNLDKAVYGMPELFREQIGSASLIANPGCYPTSIILALYPLLREGLVSEDIIVDSKSSISGAGRKASLDYHYMNVNGNVWAYKAFSHQHIPEVVEVLRKKTSKNINLRFVPHVVGVGSGIYSSSYVSFREKQTPRSLRDLYLSTYQSEPFVRVSPRLPALQDVVGTNFCDIGVSLAEDGMSAVVASAIDNLIKGAAGCAVQNMNILMGLDERTGLR